MIQLDLLCVSSAYKEKVKELPLVSLFCSCLNPRTAENPTYKAEGKKISFARALVFIRGTVAYKRPTAVSVAEV